MITSLKLRQFRSYTQEAFEFGEGVNIIVGPNASGKTNLLEAILVLCRGSSYRAKEAELMAFDAPWSTLEADTPTGKRLYKLQREPLVIAKQYVIQGQTYKRLPQTKTLPVVLFEPDHLRLLSGGPERRREYLDTLLEQTTPGFATVRRHYRRALSQRNTLLKNPGSRDNQLFAWDVQLSELGGQIVAARTQLVNTLQESINEVYKELSHAVAEVAITYDSAIPVENYSTALLQKLETDIAQDRLRGFTSHGPHRDDLMVTIGGHRAAAAASRGESRTILLALKVMELKILEAARNQKPLLLLDDVFSELDGARRRALTSFLRNYQVFITTTDADIVVQHFMDNCTIIPMTALPA